MTATDSTLGRPRAVDAPTPDSPTDPPPPAGDPAGDPATDAADDPAGDPAGDAATDAAADGTAADPATDSDEAPTSPAGDAPRPGEPAAAAAAAGFRRTALLAALAVLTLALAVLTASLALDYHRARVRAAAAGSVLGPAKTAAARILSYDYRHIQQDAAQTSGVLTGAFRGQYEAVMRQQIVPQAPKQRAVVQAEVLAAGVTAVSPDGGQAVVLVFANQTVSNTTTPRPRVDQVRVRLTLDRSGADWLVSEVDAL